jgi:hypothetical protein
VTHADRVTRPEKETLNGSRPVQETNVCCVQRARGTGRKPASADTTASYPLPAVDVGDGAVRLTLVESPPRCRGGEVSPNPNGRGDAPQGRDRAGGRSFVALTT